MNLLSDMSRCDTKEHEHRNFKCKSVMCKRCSEEIASLRPVSLVKRGQGVMMRFNKFIRIPVGTDLSNPGSGPRGRDKSVPTNRIGRHTCSPYATLRSGNCNPGVKRIMFASESVTTRSNEVECISISTHHATNSPLSSNTGRVVSQRV